MNYKLLTISLVFALSESSLAIPLLRESRTNSIDDLATIYPDHQNSSQFYYLPNKGGVAKNEEGLPLFGLVIRNKSDVSQSFGYLSFTLEASMTEKLRGQLRELKSKNPNAKFTVVPFGKSILTIGNTHEINRSAQLNPAAQAMIPEPGKPLPENFGQAKEKGFSRIYESLNLPPSAGVAETQLGVDAVLTSDGAAMFYAAISNPQQMNMHLCFQVYGALPTMHAKITMNYQKIYDYFAASARGGWLWFGWTLAHVVEKLVEDRVIQIEIIGGDAVIDDYVRMIAQDLAKTYLVEKIANGPAASYTPMNLITFGFNSAHKEQRSTVTWEFKKQQFINDDRCVSVPLAGLAPYKDRIVQITNE